MNTQNQNQWQMPPQPPTQPQKSKKKRTWLWIIVAIFVCPLIVAMFTDSDDKTEVRSNTESSQPTKEEWTASLVKHLNMHSEYLDSIPLRLKNTTSPEMLQAYAHDTRDLAEKVITDSLYMDVYSTPEVTKLMDENSVKAKKILPEVMKTWRKQYVGTIGDKLWEENIYVECPNGGTTITFIGGIFASNKNIKEWQEKVGSQLSEMGFKQVRYKWIKHDTDYTYYDL